jgi:ectoine hydroxylase-related dioxygenase (phytanoyl-CoA dioxygenase family)
MSLHVDQWWMPHPVAPDESYPRPGDATRTSAPPGPLERATTTIWPPMVVNCMHMLTDFTVENGATRVVPTSHLTGRQPDQAIPHPVPTVAAERRAGTAVVFEGRTWHAAGQNSTGVPRLGVTAYYAGPMCRQLSNFTVGTNDEVLARASPRLKALLGFKVWSTYGGIDDHAAEFIDRSAPRVGELQP